MPRGKISGQYKAAVISAVSNELEFNYVRIYKKKYQIFLCRDPCDICSYQLCFVLSHRKADKRKISGFCCVSSTGYGRIDNKCRPRKRNIQHQSRQRRIPLHPDQADKLPEAEQLSREAYLPRQLQQHLGRYIYDTGGRSLGDRLDYDDYTSSIKTELINGRNPLEHTVGGITVAYFRPLRTVDDNLCGYIIVELAKPYELAYFPVLVCVLAALFVLSALFIFIFMRALNRRLFTPIKRITDSAVYLSGDDSASVGQDASVFFETTRNDEVGKLSKALQDIFFNMNSRNENLSQALYDANHDGMTGLFNKRCYHSMVEVFKSCECICLIYFDVNNLKLMNDTLGHESGDYVITSAADFIKGIMKPTDYTFRMGGDEFLMVMTQCSYRSINDLIERLEKESPIILSKPTDSIKCALSFGYAYAKGEYDYDKKLAEAEENMYEKKAALKKELQMPDR